MKQSGFNGKSFVLRDKQLWIEDAVVGFLYVSIMIFGNPPSLDMTPNLVLFNSKNNCNYKNICLQEIYIFISLISGLFNHLQPESGYVNESNKKNLWKAEKFCLKVWWTFDILVVVIVHLFRVYNNKKVTFSQGFRKHWGNQLNIFLRELSRWWQLKYFLCSPRTLRKNFQFDAHMFQMDGSTTNQLFGTQWESCFTQTLKVGNKKKCPQAFWKVSCLG